MALLTTGVNGDLQTAATTQVFNHASVTGKSLNRFSALDIPNNTFTRDSNFWLSNIDFSGLAVWNSSSGGPQKAGTLITNQHIVVAHHYPLSVGDQIAFIGNDDIIYKRTIIEVHPRSPEPSNYYNFDYDICKLNATLPSSVVPIVLPSQGFLSILQGTGNSTLFSLSTTLPVIVTNQFNQFGTAKLANIQGQTTGTVSAILSSETQQAPYSNYQFGIIVGDSGHPTFIPLASGRLMLLTTFTSPIAGPAHPIMYLPSVDSFGNTTDTGWVAKLGGASLTFVTGYNTYDTMPPVVINVESFNTYLQRNLNSKMGTIPFAVPGHGVVIADSSGNLKDSGGVPGGIATPTSNKITFDNFINLKNFSNALTFSKDPVGIYKLDLGLTGESLGRYVFSTIMSYDIDITTATPGGQTHYLFSLFNLAGNPSFNNAFNLKIDADCNLLMVYPSTTIIIGNIKNYVGKDKIFALTYAYDSTINKHFVYINSSLIYSATPSVTLYIFDSPFMQLVCNNAGGGLAFASGNQIICYGIYSSHNNSNTYVDYIDEVIDWALNGPNLQGNASIKHDLTVNNITEKYWLNNGSIPDLSFLASPFASGSAGGAIVGSFIPNKKYNTVIRKIKTYIDPTMIPGLDAGVNEVNVDMLSNNDKFTTPWAFPDSIIVSLDKTSIELPAGISIKSANAPKTITLKNDNGSDESSDSLTFNIIQVYNSSPL